MIRQLIIALIQTDLPERLCRLPEDGAFWPGLPLQGFLIHPCPVQELTGIWFW
jgi:hypothetical protein